MTDDAIQELRGTTPTARIKRLKEITRSEPRYLSVEQARLICESYREHPGEPRVLQRAHALYHALSHISIRVDPDELILGNRTAGIRAGVVSPEAGIAWIENELETLPTREQDPFQVRTEDAHLFREVILPQWRGATLEDAVTERLGDRIAQVKSVVKINQTDHAQGHISPDVIGWLQHGPAGLRRNAEKRLESAPSEQRPFLEAVSISLAGACEFLQRYAREARARAGSVQDERARAGSVQDERARAGSVQDERARAEHAGDHATEDLLRAGDEAGDHAGPAGDRATGDLPRTGDRAGDRAAGDLLRAAEVCDALAYRPPETFHEALQSVWFLFVILQMESNASSFSPGRMDQYLLPYLEGDLQAGRLTLAQAMELLDALWIKFNQIVYMRNAGSAEYFAGFPIGFNVAIGGRISAGSPAAGSPAAGSPDAGSLAAGSPAADTTTDQSPTPGKRSDRDGDRDGTNLLSWMILTAQEHIGFSQPNLSARLWEHSPSAFVEECARIIGLGSGMPQIVNDESIIPALREVGIAPEDARDYTVVGCVELSTAGNNLGWSDAAMFNLVKALELTLNDGVCMLTGTRIGLSTGTLEDYPTFEDLQEAYRRQVDYFIDRMIPLCHAVDTMHAEFLPSPFLSAVIRDCVDTGTDVTAGGARYNLSGIQAIQVANVADSLAALKTLVFDRERRALDEGGRALDREQHSLDEGGRAPDREQRPLDEGGSPLDQHGLAPDEGNGPPDESGRPLDQHGLAPRTLSQPTPIDRRELLTALRNGFENAEPLRQTLIHHAPKYGNDVEWVDRLGAYWADHVARRLRECTNARGGPYQMGLYTVSAHVPMGKNVAATPDGRRAAEPLADGGVSAMYGRDTAGPTALLRSVARLPFHHAGNGTLLNMKFLPRTFSNREERSKFVALLRSLVDLGIHHAQFNVVNRETLLEAQKHPEEYENLTIRVAGYTAYFVELAPDLQNEIIERTAYEI